MDLQEVGWRGTDCIDQAQNKDGWWDLVNTIMNLTFMGPCIVIIFLYMCISNKMQYYTVYFIWKLLYMFRVVPPPIIRSVNNCIYSIWYLSVTPTCR
jgi:hypothetical protein